MAKLRMRHRDPENKNKGITYVHVLKGSQLNKNIQNFVNSFSIIKYLFTL